MACTLSTSNGNQIVETSGKNHCVLTCSLSNVLRATMAFTFQLPKVLRDRQFLTLLTSKCASHHKCVHFISISTCKNRLDVTVLNTFRVKMCFAPQRRALFRHLNFQKCSELDVPCRFLLANVLRVTTACTFSTSQLPKALRS